mgnify:CR=1 FL=1
MAGGFSPANKQQHRLMHLMHGFYTYLVTVINSYFKFFCLANSENPLINTAHS